MLTTLQRIAAMLYRARIGLWVAFVLAVIAFVVVLNRATDSASEASQMGTALGAFWFLALIWFGHVLSSPVPVLDPEAGFFSRLWTRLRLLGRWLLALAALGLMAMVVLFGFRAFAIFAGS